MYEELNVHRIAGYLKLHPVYVSNLFRQEVGLALGTYIQRIKIEEAKVLLKYTSHTLLEIATMLNYYDQSYFTKVFKKMAGVTPRQYKQGIVTGTHSKL
ncbi:Arabinose operon regulatory protein [compost metagenome]